LAQSIGREEGRRIFGQEPSLYDAARPDYPERIYGILRERCGLGPGCRVLEVGPGTGQATEPIAAAGASIVAVEPDRALANHLAEKAKRRGFEVEILRGTFEEVEIAPATFDLGVAATSFHWLDQGAALAKAHRLLVGGGRWAMWWNVYMDASRADPFAEATASVFAGLGRGPGMGERGRAPFALDVDARREDLCAAGFDEVEFEAMPWTARLDTAQVRALYATFSPIARLPAIERDRVLAEISEIAERSFGGRVERPFQTALYTCRRP
jgi:SAM-dependent methyltransferase